MAWKQLVYTKSCSSKRNWQHSFVRDMLRNGIPRNGSELIGTEFQVFAYIFVPRNGIPSCFLFRGTVQIRIPSVCILFCFMAKNSEHFSPLRNGSERNSENFLFRGTAGIPPEQINCSVYSVFRGIIFLSEIDNPNTVTGYSQVWCGSLEWRLARKLYYSIFYA